MYRIALNVANSQFRRDTGLRAASKEALEDRYLNRIASPEPDPEGDERLTWHLLLPGLMLHTSFEQE